MPIEDSMLRGTPKKIGKEADLERGQVELTPEQQALVESCDLTTGPAKGGMLGLLTGALGSPVGSLRGGGGAYFRRAITGKTPEGKIELTFNPDASGTTDTIWSAKAKIDGKKVSDEEALKLAYKYRAVAEFQKK